VRPAAAWSVAIALVLATAWCLSRSTDEVPARPSTGGPERSAQPASRVDGARHGTAPPASEGAAPVLEGLRASDPRGASDDVVRVVVRDEAGAPVPRARLLLTCRVDGAWSRFEIAVAAGRVAFELPHTDGPVHMSIIDPCREDGRPLNLQAIARRGALRSGREVRFALPPGREISGLVHRDDGEPAAGLPLLATHSGGSEAGAVATTDEEGRFTLHGLPPQRLEIRVRRGAGWMPLEPVPVPDASKSGTVGFVVTRVRDLEIVVCDPFGSPVPDCRVTVTWRESPHDVERRGRTDGAGAFVAADYPIGAGCRIEVDPTSCRPPFPKVSVFESSPWPDRITVRAPPAAFLSGRVLRPDRGPLEGARVEARSLATDETLDTGTDADGRFGFGPIPPGMYVLTISYASPDWLPPLPLEIEAPSTAAELVCAQPVTIRGRVHGTLLRAQQVSWTDPSGRREQTEVGPDGAFEIEGAYPGAGVLRVNDGRIGCGAFLTGLDPGDGPFEIRLDDCPDIRGRVAGRSAAREAALRMSRPGWQGSVSIAVGVDGTFRSPLLQPGTYELRLEWGRPVTVKAGDHDVRLRVER